jgi:5-formyltetrahydrofolate cyclo-ligase
VILEGPALDALKIKAKKQLRARARSLRVAIPRPALLVRSLAIIERLEALEWVRAAKALALFWPMEDRGEVDLKDFDTRCRALGKAVFYPYYGPTLAESGFARVNDPEELEERGRGFREPSAEAVRAEPGDLDVVVVPALAASASGHRLGYGAGFYDGVLARFCPPARSVIVAYDFELLAEMPTEAHDVACDVIVTDARTLSPSHE